MDLNCLKDMIILEMFDLEILLWMLFDIWFKLDLN